MPISWRIVDGVVFLKSIGSATFEEWRAAVEGFLAHPDHKPGMGVVHDWRGLGEAPLPSDIRTRADYVKRHASSLARPRWALVVTEGVNYGMGRMAEGLVDGSSVELRAFRDLAEAEAWVRGG
jgi:hypothetical protein